MIISVTSNPAGKTFPVEITAIAPHFRVLLYAFGVPLKLVLHPDNGYCLLIEAQQFKTAKPEVEKLFAARFKNCQTWIKITNDSVGELQSLIYYFAAKKRAWDDANAAV